MNEHLILLRGINVSGKNIIKMERLREVLSQNGFENVKTYIQSGNILLESEDKNSEKVAREIENLIETHFELHVSAIAVSKKILKKVLEENPFLNQNSDLKKLYVVFLSAIPLEESKMKLLKTNLEPDEFKISGKIVYLKYHDTAGNSKLSNKLIENKLKVNATMRNWNTIQKLLEL